VHGQTDLQASLQAIAAALNDGGLDDFDTVRIQRMVEGAIGGKLSLTVDDGGGLHGASGARVGAIRRAPSGEWIIDGQNADAARADSEIPAAAQEHREPGTAAQEHREPGKNDNEQR
jgi:hypothetical protein